MCLKMIREMITHMCEITCSFSWLGEGLQHAYLILPQSNVLMGCQAFVFLHMPHHINASVMTLFGTVDFLRHIYVSFLELFNGTGSPFITPFLDKIFSQESTLLGLHMIKKIIIIICFIVKIIKRNNNV